MYSSGCRITVSPETAPAATEEPGGTSRDEDDDPAAMTESAESNGFGAEEGSPDAVSDDDLGDFAPNEQCVLLC